MKLPSINETAFVCPHCGAFTSQRWLSALGNEFQKDHTPHFPALESIEKWESDPKLNDTARADILKWAAKMRSRQVFSDAKASAYATEKLWNLNVSQCYVCGKFAVWVADRMVFPTNPIGPNPIPDMPADVSTVFQEARQIANESPRGAAALLRLCVQMLCSHLGEKGKSIDDDIASLVSKGLNPTVQKSLDIVRVIGNEAVHPGTIDLKDDRDTALMLFDLVNAIVDQMISHPKKVDALYAKLPEAKRQAIEKRDKKAGA